MLGGIDPLLKNVITSKQVRENCVANLHRVVATLGSAAKAAKIMGVNRSQLSRYLSGSAMPRVETLFALAQHMNVSLEWFLSNHDEEPNFAGRIRFAQAMSNLVKGRSFEVSDDVLADGFYVFWKGLWRAPQQYEALFSKVESIGGAKAIHTKMTRALKRDGLLEDHYHDDLTCNGVIIQSAGNLTVLFSDTANNVMIVGYLEKQDPKWEFGGNSILAGHLTVHLPQTDTCPQMMPILLEKVAPTTAATLSAARSVASYQYDDLPKKIRHSIDRLSQPIMRR